MKHLGFALMIVGGYVMGWSHAQREKPRTYVAQCYVEHQPQEDRNA